MTVMLPYEFTPRHYQKDVFKALFTDNIKRIVSIWHRRAGKDKSYINLIVAASQQRVGTYLYLFPELNQARRVIWNGIDKDGKRFLDHFPKQIISKTNGTDMRIEFKNGSIFQLGGSDRYDSLMGTNPVGIVFSEYSLQNPTAWHYLRPILAENGGWGAFNYTPRGRNHGFDLYDKAKDNAKWFVQKLDVNETSKGDGSPVITDEIIQEERDSGMPEELIQQEFYCSFEAAVPGSYYAQVLNQAEEEGRILDFPIESGSRVYTFWDLGISDSTAIWFLQPIGSELRLINYYENCGEGLEHYINYLHDFRDKHRIVYGDHWAPHDIKVRELTTGRSRLETARQMGIEYRVVANLPIADGIHGVRQLFSRFYIHKTNCEQGLNRRS